MAIKGAANKTHTGGARSIFAQTVNAGLHNFWMIGEPQIIIAAEARNITEIAQLHGGVHGAFYGLQQFQLSIFLQLLQDLMGSVLKMFGSRGGGVHVGAHGVFDCVMLRNEMGNCLLCSNQCAA